VETGSLEPIIARVLGVFKPKRVIVATFGSDDAFDCFKSLPGDKPSVYITELTNDSGSVTLEYKRTTKASTLVGNDLRCSMGRFMLSDVKEIDPSSGHLKARQDKAT
jgi:hypothetical protein